MLVVTRRIGEEIIIDKNIHIKIVAVRGRNVRLGITAPPTIRVARSEVAEPRAPFADGDQATGSRKGRRRTFATIPHVRDAGPPREV